jgi:hypothetical protein
VSTYQELRDTIRTGDILGVKGRDPISIVIRSVTGESLNHVAVFVWLDDGLWIAEMNSKTNFTMAPASDYVARKKGSLFVIYMPEADQMAMKQEILRTRARDSNKAVRYSFTTLGKVFVSQVIRFNIYERVGKVCSTFAQHVRKIGGHDLTSLPMDPGDFMHVATRIVPIQRTRDDDPYSTI